MTAVRKLTLLALGGALSGIAAPFVVTPSGLNPGDTYRLVFSTTGQIGGTSANVSDYNTFATNQADASAQLLALGTNWSAIVSTPSVNAIDNIGGASAVPIYNLAGDLVANGTAGLFSGSLMAPIDIPFCCAPVWTGTNISGTADNPLGGTSDAGQAELGSPPQTNANWIELDVGSEKYTSWSLYAISGVLTVPSPATSTPEPVTVGVTTAGLLTILLASRRRNIHRS